MVVVHFAPRQCLANAIHAVVGAGYATADKEPGGADQVLDLTALAMPDKSVDGLIASHVLEHIEDDAQALREIRRMLRPGGWALLIVPQRLGRPTFEDPVAAASGAAARNEAFGHPDHVRWYGGDFADRIAGAGLEVEAFDPVGCLGDAKATRQALGTDTIHLCQRGK
ncbi:MAG: class I SAM-dependent methyltransferase [Candidatus Lernaella stagnicola]|nr:class I SAM-dependent methyltransferase [Candidatus Lernaella stagnicola]